MEVSRYLRTDRINKNGYAPIRILVQLDGKQVPLSIKERCKPEHWDSAAQKLKGKAPYAHSINARLSNHETILTNIKDNYDRQNILLTPDLLKKEFKEAIKPKVITPEPEPEPEQEPLASEQEELSEEDAAWVASESSEFIGYFKKWLQHQSTKKQLTTGKKLAKSSIKAYNATINRFIKFQIHRNAHLRFEEMNLKFYQEFQHYILVYLDQSVNYFGKLIDHLKGFLKWVDINYDDILVHKQFRAFESPEIYVGADALTAQELHAIYSIDFDSEEVSEKLYAYYIGKGVRQLDGQRFHQWRQSVIEARDKFLCCCYTGMRISDASSFTENDVNLQDGIIYKEATKTLNECYIPFYDDELFKPREIVMRYWGKYPTCMPPVPDQLVNENLKFIQKLVKITRLNLTTKIGRKTFCTLKVYQGVPARIIMQASGHKTEANFNRYVGINIKELKQAFRTGSATLSQNKKVGKEMGKVLEATGSNDYLQIPALSE